MRKNLRYRQVAMIGYTCLELAINNDKNVQLLLSKLICIFVQIGTYLFYVYFTRVKCIVYFSNIPNLRKQLGIFIDVILEELITKRR